MDIRIKNGDTAYSLSGDSLYVSGIEEMLQRVKFCLTTPRGSLRYNRDFGCAEIGFVESSRDLKNLESKLKEATANIKDVKVSLLSAENISSGVRVVFRLDYRDDFIKDEVILR